MSSVKGHAVISCKNYLQRHYGNDSILKLKSELNEIIYQKLINIKGNENFPIEDFIKLNKAISSIFGENELNIIREIGRQSSTDAVRGVFKAFFKFGNPQFIIKIASEIFSKYYTTGKLSFISSTSNSVITELTEFQIDDINDMKYICTRIEGWIERSLEISAGREITTTQEKCISNGDDSCIFVSNWE